MMTSPQLQDMNGWVGHTDASGRAYLAHQVTNETRWLWNKWSINGRVFCVNAVSNERVWQEDMSLEVRLEAGIPPPPPPPDQALSLSYAHAPLPEKRHPSCEDASNRLAKRAKIERNNQRHVRCEPCNFVLPSSTEWLAHCSSFAHQQVVMALESAKRARQSSSHAREAGFGEARNGYAPGPSMAASSEEKRCSRFSPAPRLSPTFRQLPSSPVSRDISPRRRSSSFRPSSKRARAMRNCVSSDKFPSLSRTALLYDRDFAISPKSTSALTNGVGDCNSQDGVDASPGAVVGLSTAVEKMYLRLTSAPNPADVRPVTVLKRSLKLVKKCWAKQTHDYEWVCSQLKSIRQDLQIQHIETTLVLDTYETHARIALENGDFGEFNTCVAQLSELYQRLDRLASVQDEFAAYRILYDVLVGENESEHARMLNSTSTDERARPAVKYAMVVRRSVIEGNYEHFFRLYMSPPPRTMATFLLDQMAEYVRSRALAAMCCAYSPGKLSLAFVMSQLGWNALDDADLRTACSFCEKIGVVIAKGADGSQLVNTKASRSGGVSILRSRRGLITAAGVQ